MNLIQEREARVMITWDGQTGDLPDTVARDASDAEIQRWATEAVRTGSIPGIDSDVTADCRDFIVDRWSPTAVRPYTLIQVRPKTPFG
jgi:hypothetical protein